MNYKLEKFWNNKFQYFSFIWKLMNYKLEKFWNLLKKLNSLGSSVWTINLKSFEIKLTEQMLSHIAYEL